MTTTADHYLNVVALSDSPRWAFNAVGGIGITASGRLIFSGSYTSDLSDFQKQVASTTGWVKAYAGGYGMYAAQNAAGNLFVFGYATGSDEDSTIKRLMQSVVTEVRFNYGAGAAKLSDGSIVSWGHNGYEEDARSLIVDARPFASGPIYQPTS